MASLTSLGRVAIHEDPGPDLRLHRTTRVRDAEGEVASEQREVREGRAGGDLDMLAHLAQALLRLGLNRCQVFADARSRAQGGLSRQAPLGVVLGIDPKGAAVTVGESHVVPVLEHRLQGLAGSFGSPGAI